METLKEKIQSSSAVYPATSVMRNYLASSGMFATRYCEYYDGEAYHIRLVLFRKENGPPVQLFCVKDQGKKNQTVELCFLKLAAFIDKLFLTQGLDESISIKENPITMPEENMASSKEENVIITGAEDAEHGQDMIVKETKLADWSCSEKYYEFVNGDSAVMNRWFPLDSVKISTTDSYAVNGGMLKSWVIPEALFKDNMNAINTLPVRGFVMGKYEIEFKMVVQANPFQACCIMMGVIPYSYGLYPEYKALAGFSRSTLSTDVPLSWQGRYTYVDMEVAVQRPHVLLDVAGGGEATLSLSQKYHKTLLRNFDYGYVDTVNPGLRGSHMGALTLHLISNLQVGSANENHFNVRIFFRFKTAKLTAMSEIVDQRNTGSLSRLPFTSYSKRGDFMAALEIAQKSDKRTKTRDRENALLSDLSSYQTQGPVMSVIGGVRGVVDVADQALHVVEDFGNKTRKGFGTKNRDKPNDCLAVRVIPRPRSNFQAGEGIDDALILAMGWTEMTQFFETFEEEPKSFADFNKLPGLLARFPWNSNKSVGSEIFRWNVHPTVSPTISNSNLAGNILRAPTNISSSMFTNYCGTMELFFQFVKTAYHKGAVEVAIHFGRVVDGTGLKSSYVKVLNVQECNGFSVTIPYIYDTAMRVLNGTSIPMTIPGITTDEYYALSHTSVVSVTVLNELSAPTTVSSSIEVLVWLKAGNDFGLVFPRASNNLMSCVTSPRSGLMKNPVDVRKFLGSPNPQPQYVYDPNNGKVLPLADSTRFVVQGNEEDSPDFIQPAYSGNRVTSVEHMNFKTILKMPICILSNFTLPTKQSVENQGYTYKNQVAMFLPVTCINNTLLEYLQNQFYADSGSVGAIPLVQSIQNQITSMFGFYRGGIVYTIVIKQGSHLNVGYLPHDYKVRSLLSGLTEQQQYYTVDSGKTFLRYDILNLGALNEASVQTNLSNQLVNQSFMLAVVNPSEKYLVPMSSQNNWLLLNRKRKDNSTIGMNTMRENSEWFNGHLVLWNTSPDNGDVVVDVYMNCADDFELGAFLGHVGVSNPYANFALADNWRTQGMDFKFKELTQKGWNSLKEILVQSSIGIGLSILTQNLAPEVGSLVGAVAIYSCVGAVPQIMELKKTLEQGALEAEKVKQQVEEVCEAGVETLLKMIVQFFPYAATKETGKSLWIITQNIVHSALSLSWKNCSFAMFCILMETKLFTMEDWTSLKDHFLNFVSAMLPTGFQSQGLPWEPLMEVLVSLIAAKFQIGGTGGLKWYFAELFQWQNYKHVNGLSSIIKLTKSFYLAVAKIIEWAVEEADPNVSLLKALQNQESNLAQFMEDANLYLNNFNDNDFKRKHNRIRFLHTILRAFKLRLVLLKIANPRLTGQLLALCNKVIDKANKQRYLFKCDIIKSEPFIVGVVGKPNIGKSFSVFKLSTTLLRKIDYQSESPDLIFTVPTGLDYWNGYADQPVIWYDDWCNLRDDQTMRQHIGQLYGLKTSAPFNVPRAELENKEQIAAPHVIFLTSNHGFPNSPVMSDQEAVYRRRDILVDFRLKEGKKIEEFTKEQKQRYEHIEVRYYKDPTRQDSLDESEVLSFTEFENRLADQFYAFHKKELVNKNHKYELLMECVRKTKIDSLNLENPFDLIEGVISDNEKLCTSDLLMSELERLVKLIDERVEMSSHEVTDEEIFSTQGCTSGKVKVALGTASLKALMSEWLKKGRRKLYVCENCHDSAQKHGTVIWCPQGAHYMCFHCALLAPPVTYTEEEEFNETGRVHRNFVCAQHGCSMEIRQESFLSGMIAEMIHNKVSTLENFYNLIRGLMGHASLQNKFVYSLLILLQIYIGSMCALLWGRTFGKMARNYTQSDEEIICRLTESEREYMEEMLNQDNYGLHRCSLPNYEEMFNKMPQGSRSKYCCPHSLLINGFTYINGSFNVDVEEEVVCIEDSICSHKCVLTNLKFLKKILLKFDVSPEYIDKYQLGDIKITKFYFPKFLWPRNLGKRQSSMEKIKNLLARNWWENYVSPAGEVFMKLVKKIYPVLIACGILWGASKISCFAWATIKQFFGLDLEVEAFSYPNGSPKRSRNGRPRSAKNPYSSQSVSENFENKLNKIANNYIVLETEGFTATAWGVCGSTFVIPKHLSRRLENKKMIVLSFVTRPHEKLEILRESLEIMEVEDQDLALVNIKNCKILFKDCRKFIPTRREAMFDQTKGIIMDVDCVEMKINDYDLHLIAVTHNSHAIDPTGEEVKTKNGVMYDYERKGMCGSLVCVDTQFPVLAMHISGSPAIRRGMGVLLFRDLFLHVQCADEIFDTGDDTNFYGDDIVLSYEASIPEDMIPHIPEKTNLAPSLIDACFEAPSKVQPAFLSAKQEGYPHDRSPLFYGVQRNGKPSLDFPKYYRTLAYQMVSTRVLTGQLIRNPQIMSVEESVLGLPSQMVDDPFMYEADDDIYYGPIPLDTSAGWPYATPRLRKEFGISTTSKAGWIEFERDKSQRPIGVKIREKILLDHKQSMLMRERGLPAINVFQDCLKDEKRSIQKTLKEGGTRLFSMSNIEGTIALRRYTLDFTSYLRYNRLKNGIAVGINPDSFEWTLLAEMLLRNGENIFTLDFSNFGAGLNFDCGMLFGDLVVEFFKKNNVEVSEKVIRALMLELMGSRHVVNNLIYKTYSGSPSGAAITVEINSVVHLVYAAIAWLIIGDVLAKVTNKNSIKWHNLLLPYSDLQAYLVERKLPYVEMTAENFMTEVVGVVYGDDGLYSVTDGYREYFNAVTINLVLKEHRIGVTDATKSENITPYTSLEEATFLKRRFVRNELIPELLWAAAIDWQSVEECVRWIHKKPLTPEAATRENCESSLLLAWGHGKKKYEAWRWCLNQCLEKVNLRPILMTWEDVALKFYPELKIEII